MSYKSLPLIALVGALALAGCNKAPETTDNAMVNVGEATDLDDTPANDETPVIENVGASTTEAVAIPAVPKPAADAPAAEAAPLADAGAIEEEIRAGTGIQRVRYGDGWAWTRGGQILRTADRDGRDVAYFRGGQAKPFIVHRGDSSYAYQGDKPVRAFDRDGRGSTPDADRSREANEAARKAQDQHNEAEKAREHARPGDGRTGRPDRGQASPTPTPSPSPTARGHDRNRDKDGDDNRARTADGPRRDNN